ncbi:MAG TPA: GrpB family protein [Mesotoga infera]|nr:GrpB family protein [Mesotoga sp.]HON28872.1 GrpB family protein [Mesotoga infera]HPD38631.1 GrpB family protein [Mesotoga infera]HRR44829.1 GrpB family protein [Mesotoga sp.]HRV02217.1 GrpB family protein [Mesotoga sp.]
MRGKPVIVTEYCSRWPEFFREEADRLKKGLSDPNVAIEHIGSTAVPGLSAKPVIDILIGVDSLDHADSLVVSIQKLGYTYIQEYESMIPDRRYFERDAGEIDFHIHMVVFGGAFWTEHVFFRDYLREDPEAVEQYSALKKSLSKEHQNNREAYSRGKAEFIASIMSKIRN